MYNMTLALSKNLIRLLYLHCLLILFPHLWLYFVVFRTESEFPIQLRSIKWKKILLAQKKKLLAQHCCAKNRRCESSCVTSPMPTYSETHEL